jgi:hypothetical protein
MLLTVRLSNQKKIINYGCCDTAIYGTMGLSVFGGCRRFVSTIHVGRFVLLENFP